MVNHLTIKTTKGVFKGEETEKKEHFFGLSSKDFAGRVTRGRED